MSEDIKDIISLLDKISSINEKDEERLKKSGEKFNIFEELKLKKAEWVHSRVLATLLDPCGSHGKGNLFLKKFLEIIAKKHETNAETNEDEKGEVGEKFSIKGVKVQEEKSLDGGRPDIIITNQDCKKIILENKIDAKEGNEQLKRYSKEEPIHLIFLTLGGRKSKKKGGKFSYIRMSYKKDILEWLEWCKKESIDNPILNGILTQYILLIKQITGQPGGIDMEEKIIDAIINDSKYVSAAFDIANSIEAMKMRILKEKFLTTLREIANDRGFEFETDLHGNVEKEKCCKSYFEENEVDFWLYKKKWNYLAICLSFRKEKKGFSYGLNSKEKVNGLHPKLKETGLYDNQKIIDKAKEEAKEFGYYICYNGGDNEYSLLLCKETKSLWENWANTNKFFTDIVSENGIETMKTEFRNVIKELSEIGDRLEAE